MNDVFFRMEKELNGRERHNVQGVATHLERHTWPQSCIQLWYHWTPVVTAYPETGAVELYTNGYQTLTTKERINRYLNVVRWQVVQRNYDWYVVSPEGKVYDFYSGMRVYPDENKVEYESRSITQSEAAKKLERMFKKWRIEQAAFNQKMGVYEHEQPKTTEHFTQTNIDETIALAAKLGITVKHTQEEDR